MPATPIRPVRNAFLSLWQSSVAEAIRKEERLTSEAPGHARIRAHPMMIAATAHAVGVVQRAFEPRALVPAKGEGPEADAYVSELKHEIAEASIAGNTQRVEALLKECRKYATCDWKGWKTCLEAYRKYRKLYDGVPLYNDWREKGKDIKTYGVIDYRLPDNAKVALLGDWATGMDDAEKLLADILKTHRPDAVIHVGDIYYSGTPDECRLNFAATVNNAFAQAGVERVPVLTIPGNHDYYAFGSGYYPLLGEVNPEPAWRQEASYFCLRTEDDAWQFLAMDTGRHDYYPLNDVDPFYSGPWLEPSEIEWHLDKLAKATFPGQTILLSHHMLFSQHSPIGPRLSDRPWLNEHLFDVFQPHFGKVAGWFWGHEHNLALFEDGLLGLPKGRLVGCSGYEESEGEDPYAPHNADFERNVPYREPVVKLGKEQGYYDHGYAVFDFSREKADDPITVTYYSYPSWGKETPVSPKSKPLATERLGNNPGPDVQVVQYGEKLNLRNKNGEYIVGADIGRQYYPRLDSTGQVELEVRGGVGDVENGAVVQIKSTEEAVEGYSYLGAWTTTHNLYYYSKDYSKDKQSWKLQKVTNPDDPKIRWGEKVFITNMSFVGQRMIKDTKNPAYLTTKKNVEEWWIIEKP